MRPVYEAAHGVEAHMIADLLRQEGIAGLVQGEYLQGAVGGLPAAGLVRVVVDDDDFDRARAVIDGWLAAQVADEPRRAPSAVAAAAQWSWFAAGLLVGAFAAALTGLGSVAAFTPDAASCRPSR
jgi:hypothetical protein